LLLGTDHYEYSVYGINNINTLLGLNPFSGIFSNPTLPVDPLNPLMNTPIDMGAQLFDDSSTGQTPYGLQPNGQILYTVAWHSGNQDTPGISSTIEGVIGLHTTITSPHADSQFCTGNTIILTAQANGGTPAYTYAWSSSINGNLGNGQTLNIDSSSLTPGTHTIRVVTTDAAGRIDDDQIQINVSTCQIEPNPINIDLSPDTAINPVGTEHTVTATVNDSNGKPYEGILVIFSIIAGPNSPWNSTGTTNASGKATFTYTGDEGIGTDSIIAFINLNDTIESDIVTKEWTEQEINGFMTGGGSVLKEPFVPSGDRPGKPKSDRVTHGFELNCDAGKAPNNLEVNWGKGNRFHLDALTFAVCRDDPSIVPNPPTAGFDKIKGTGTGKYNGVSGATVRFVFTDAGEPGMKDTAHITIEDALGNVVLDVFGNLNNGNHQAHNPDFAS